MYTKLSLIALLKLARIFILVGSKTPKSPPETLSRALMSQRVGGRERVRRIQDCWRRRLRLCITNITSLGLVKLFSLLLHEMLKHQSSVKKNWQVLMWTC